MPCMRSGASIMGEETPPSLLLQSRNNRMQGFISIVHSELDIDLANQICWLWQQLEMLHKWQCSRR